MSMMIPEERQTQRIPAVFANITSDLSSLCVAHVTACKSSGEESGRSKVGKLPSSSASAGRVAGDFFPLLLPCLTGPVEVLFPQSLAHRTFRDPCRSAFTPNLREPKFDAMVTSHAVLDHFHVLHATQPHLHIERQGFGSNFFSLTEAQPFESLRTYLWAFT